MKHQGRRYYLLTEDQPCWMWTRKEDNTLDWSIIGYNSKEVSPRKEIPEEDIQKEKDDYAIEFALFLSTECETNGDKDGWWFYNKTWKTTNELLIQFKKEKGL
jgi:hypothetical protein